MLTTDPKLIGIRIKARRNKLGFTQKEIAKKADMSLKSYTCAEKGVTHMKIQTFLKICSALQVLPDELLCDEENTERSRKIEILRKLEKCDIETQKEIIELVTLCLKHFS